MPLARIAVPARAIADAVPFYRSDGSVRALVAAAVQGNHCTTDELRSALDGAARRGSAIFRRTVDEVRDGARSVAEVHASEQLRCAPVPDFELNVPIVDADRRTIAIADVLWRALWAILEIDSREFHFSAEDWHQTTYRHNQLTARGFAVTHYPPSRVMAGKQWTEEVASWLQARALELNVPYQAGSRVVRDGPPVQLPFRVTQALPLSP
jgi:hypothetical protein